MSTPRGISTIVIYGSTGTIGSGLVKHYLQQSNVCIVAPIRSDPSQLLTQLGLTAVPEKLLIPVIPTYLDEPELLTTWITANAPEGKVDHVVVICGGLLEKYPVSQITQSLLDEGVHLKVYPVIRAFVAFQSILRDETTSSFTVVTGGAGLKCFYPDFGLLTIANSAQFGVTQGIISESADKKFRVNEFRIQAVIKKDQDPVEENIPGYPTMKTSAAAKFFHLAIFSSNAKGTIVNVTGPELQKV